MKYDATRCTESAIDTAVTMLTAPAVTLLSRSPHKKIVPSMPMTAAMITSNGVITPMTCRNNTVMTTMIIRNIHADMPMSASPVTMKLRSMVGMPAKCTSRPPPYFSNNASICDSASHCEWLPCIAPPTI